MEDALEISRNYFQEEKQEENISNLIKSYSLFVPSAMTSSILQGL